MKPLSALPAADARALRGVLFDCDDTLLDGSLLTEQAYRALWDLSRAGLRLLAVTGRPAGWGEVIARQWPVDAAVTENGAVAFYREGHVLRRRDEADEATRRSRRVRIASAAADLRARFPEARITDDSHLRWSDLAFDIGESQRVPADVVDAMARAARAMGMHVFVSSVHLHVTLDPHDKATGTLALLRDRFGEDPTQARFAYAFVGDSGNDAACFSAFRTTFGVANVRAAVGRLSTPPAWVAERERGAGFAEIARKILDLRG